MDYEKISWSEFREMGLFHFVNSFLHLFGMAIVLCEEDDGTTTVYPARTEYRGFPQESNDKAYARVENFLQKKYGSPMESKMEAVKLKKFKFKSKK